MTKDEWLDVCRKNDIWCLYDLVAGMTKQEFEEEIQATPVWIPQEEKEDV